MSLTDMRCDRCGELHTDLWHSTNPIRDPAGILSELWFCSSCMLETGQELDPEIKHLVKIMKQRELFPPDEPA
jgi:hypothetical protein